MSQQTAPNNRPKAKGIVEMLRTSFGLERYLLIAGTGTSAVKLSIVFIFEAK